MRFVFIGNFSKPIVNLTWLLTSYYITHIAMKSKTATLAITRGFTLLELLVVVAIIGLLAGYVGPKYFNQLGKAEIKATKAQINALGRALDQYRLDVGHYPKADQGLSALIMRPTSEPKWAGPYLDKDVPLDPWGNPYQYRIPGTLREYDLFSYGHDGRPGGTNDDADIGNW